MSSKLSRPAYEYYYGYTKQYVSLLANMPYQEALKDRITSAKALIKTLIEVPLLTRDTTRINDIVKAIKFNEELLKELI